MFSEFNAGIVVLRVLLDVTDIEHESLNLKESTSPHYSDDRFIPADICFRDISVRIRVMYEYESVSLLRILFLIHYIVSSFRPCEDLQLLSSYNLH